MFKGYGCQVNSVGVVCLVYQVSLYWEDVIKAFGSAFLSSLLATASLWGGLLRFGVA